MKNGIVPPIDRKAFRWIWLLQPILIAAYPFMEMFAKNPEEATLLHFLFGISITTIFISVVFLFFLLFYKSSFKSVIMTNTFVLFFYISPAIIHSIFVPISKYFFSITPFGIRIFRVRNLLIIVTILAIYLSHTFLVKKIK